MYYVYILESEGYEHFYIGYSANVYRRIREHNQGKVFWTKKYRPWKLIYQERFKNKNEAIKREKYFKSHAGRNWLKKIFMRL